MSLAFLPIEKIFVYVCVCVWINVNKMMLYYENLITDNYQISIDFESWIVMFSIVFRLLLFCSSPNLFNSLTLYLCFRFLLAWALNGFNFANEFICSTSSNDLMGFYFLYFTSSLAHNFSNYPWFHFLMNIFHALLQYQWLTDLHWEKWHDSMW